MLVRNYACFALRSPSAPRNMGGRSSSTEIKRVTDVDQAVNDTANLWQSIFWNALGPERAWQLYGITEPVKETSNGSRC
jgi:hypothetical protein